jgi:hypothetical protein
MPERGFSLVMGSLQVMIASGDDRSLIPGTADRDQLSTPKEVQVSRRKISRFPAA